MAELTRSLNIISKMKGWDPSNIEGFDKSEYQADFNPDKDGTEVGYEPGCGFSARLTVDPRQRRYTGEMRDVPPPSVPEGYPDSPLSAKVTWTVGGPNDDGNHPIRHTNGADPTPGMPGA